MMHQDHFKKAMSFLDELDDEIWLSNSTCRCMVADYIAAIAVSRDELASALDGLMQLVLASGAVPPISEITAARAALAKARGEAQR